MSFDPDGCGSEITVRATPSSTQGKAPAVCRGPGPTVPGLGSSCLPRPLARCMRTWGGGGLCTQCCMSHTHTRTGLCTQCGTSHTHTHLCWCACVRITPFACRVSACVCTRACALACVCMYVHTCMRARVCTCVCRVCATVYNVCVSLRACVRVQQCACHCVRLCVRACRWGGREAGAEGSLGRKGGWGGREPEVEGSLGRKGAWGGREYGAEGSMGRTEGAWGGGEPGAEGSMAPRTQRPLWPSSYDISQPAGRHLPN